MIDTKALRSRVLDLAIQGKLTEQLESDGTAEELWQQIQAEKQRLIKEGRIKREKPLPEITPNEIPFEIPENWKWVRLGNIGNWGAGATPSRHNSDYYNGSIAWLKTGDLTDGEINEVSEYITEKALAECSIRLNPIGSVLIAMYGATIGKLGILNRPVTTNQACCACIPYGGVDNKFLFYFLLCERNDFINKGHGGAQPNISKEIIVNSLIPIPPLAEQKRIVARVEEIFRLLDIIDAAQEQYAADAESLKAKLITLGIQGRLTEQLESDGTAEELYQQIQAEKQRLIKEGKIKREKPLPEISEDEIPFEIPENWKWVYLGEIFQHNTGKALNSANADGKLLEYITTSNVYWDRFELKSLKQMRFTEDEIEKCTIKKGDLLICEGGDIGRSAIWCFDYDMRIQNHLHRLRGYIPDICVKYYYYLMWLYKATGKIDGRGIGLQGFSSKRVHSLIVPLPPLAEQKRIAETLERVLGVL